jgi:putative tricarboxylic transport membrane protein
MDFFEHLSLGCHVAFSLANLLYCFIGVLFGTLIGVLPGIGPAGAIAMLLPITFGINPASAIIMLAGIYYGAQYGGSTTSILVNIPGESASVVTCIDGYKMARNGRAGPALGIAAFGSFIAGTLTIVPLMILAKPLSTVAIRFGPPEYFAIVILGLTLLINLAHGSVFKGYIMALFGLALSQIGMDMITGRTRYTFEIIELQGGVGLIPLVMGLFGVGEVLENLGKSMDIEIFKTKIKGLFPNLEDWKNSIGAILRGTVLGFFLGLLPGGGAILASFTSYTVEKRISKHPEKFGTGVIEGVAGPESANNAGAQGNFIPLFVLGIPSNAVMGLLLGALMIHNVMPGPFFISKHPDIFWGTVVSMYIGNVMLLVLNLPLIPLWVRVLKVPYRILFPLILLFCIIGVYSVDNNLFDVFLMVIFGVIGFLLKQFKYEMAPLVLAFILGPMAENAFRQSLIISQGSLMMFFSRPVTLIALMIAFFLVLSHILPFIRKRREVIAGLEG